MTQPDMTPPHVTVCICTFKRPDLLRRLLDRLVTQTTDRLFTYSIAVSDNDTNRSAESTVASFASSTHVEVVYGVEPRANIALARNHAIRLARGEFIAFIDDDEIPVEDWLLHLFEARRKYGADGVLGPVEPVFDYEPPTWVTKGKFFDRPQHPTGFKLGWFQARSGNVLFARSILHGDDAPFDAQFDAAGEDVDFFNRMMSEGRTFVWSREAIAFETVPAARCTRRYLLKRAVLRGSNFPKHSKGRVKNVLKSLIAAPCYAIALPLLAVCGQHVFVRYLIKLFDHVSRLLAFVGIPLVTQRQT